jgi:hypothetical protein
MNFFRYIEKQKKSSILYFFTKFKNLIFTFFFLLRYTFFKPIFLKETILLYF